MLPVTAVDGMIFCSKSPWGLFLGDRQETKAPSDSRTHCVMSKLNIVSISAEVEIRINERGYCTQTEVLYFQIC
jgi:hypothetical protein